MSKNLSHRIDEIIANAYVKSSDDSDSSYQQNFADEGLRKAQYVVDDLEHRNSHGLIQQERLMYLCIGGADGSEVDYVLSETAISKAVMIEISTKGVAKARKRISELERYNKEFVILEGDASAKLDDALDIADNWFASGAIDGLVCSAQGVLHELPTRSTGFDLPIFLGKIFRNPDWQVCAFYSREPSLPEGWPAKVRIKIPGLPASQLVRFSQYVRDRLRMTGTPQALASGWVSLGSSLAIETLHKLIREGTISRIGYELEEQLTGFDPIAVKENLESIVEGMHVTVENITTSGFKAALREYNVEYRGHESEPLPVPKTHSEVIGFMCSLKKDSNAQPKVLFNNSANTPVEANFNNPFGENVSDNEIRDWLAQFTSEERPLIARLLSGFVYLSYNRVQSMVVDLHDMLREKLGEDFNRACFVPMGGAGGSGSFVSYIFRSRNRISKDRMVRPGVIGDRFI